MHTDMSDLVLKEVLLLSSQKQLQKVQLAVGYLWEPYIAKDVESVVDIRLATDMFKYVFKVMKFRWLLLWSISLQYTVTPLK